MLCFGQTVVYMYVVARPILLVYHYRDRHVPVPVSLCGAVPGKSHQLQVLCGGFIGKGSLGVGVGEEGRRGGELGRRGEELGRRVS